MKFTSATSLIISLLGITLVNASSVPQSAISVQELCQGLPRSLREGLLADICDSVPLAAPAPRQEGDPSSGGLLICQDPGLASLFPFCAGSEAPEPSDDESPGSESDDEEP